MKPGYKQTEVGVIPEDWEVANIQSVCRDNITYGIVQCGPHVNDGIPYVRVSDMDRPELQLEGMLRTSRLIAAKFPRSAVSENDIIYALRGKLGEVRRVPPDIAGANLTQGTAKISPNEKVVSEYLLRVMRCPTSLRQAEREAKGTTFREITLGDLRRIKIPVPPLPEQRAIAGALSDVDALLGAQEALLAKKRDLKAAAMQQLLTGQKRLPGFTGEWEVKRLGEMANLNRLNVVPANSPSELFTHFSLPAFDAGKIPPIELGASIGSNKFRVLPDAVLVSKLNPRIPRIWMPDYIPENAIASTEWLVLTPKEGTNRRFLHILCSSPAFCEQMELGATGTTGSHQRVSPGTALGIVAAVPIEQTEQTAIAAVLSDMDAEIAALEAQRDKTRALKQGMMQELLTGRIRLV